MRVIDRPRVAGRRFGGPDAASILVGAITGASQGNLLAGLAAVYDTAEFRTSVTPPAVVDLYAAAHDQSPPSPIVEFLKPTLILSGSGGTEVFAPYGQADGGWGPAISALTVIIGIGFGLGWYARGRR